jgi:type VI secretion system protein ImpL
VVKLLKNPWVVQSVGVLALSVLVWFAGPLIAIAGTAPLDTGWARGVAIAVLGVAWVIFRLVAELRAARKSRRFMDELAEPGEPGPDERSAAGENLERLAETFQEALKQLRDTRGGQGGRGPLLHELPWYIIIGPPGSGKTTALVNSGLKFPLADRFGQQPVRGVSGTRHCEWLFTDEAILIDTAGRYTTQESHRAVDAAEWQGFLGLLKQHRPRRPINGVLVTVSLADLLQQTEEERGLNARAIRLRVQELHAGLGIRFPVYVLLTKVDLVAGFTDFFGDLNETDRAQVWGETFPAEDPKRPANDGLARFAAGYDQLLERLDRRALHRLNEERDLARRGLILDFPRQLALLRPVLTKFLEDAFAPNRYDIRPLLRGIYFTSGTQEGTPIDRIMGLLAAAYQLNRQAIPVYSGRGRSYFLTRLLREVIFPEAELAGGDPRIERRQRLLQAGAGLAVLLAVVVMAGSWTLSYRRNAAAIDRVGNAVERYRASAPAEVGRPWPAPLRALLPRLDALREARDAFGDSGWSMHLGLYQGHKLEQAAGHAYAQRLKDQLLPLILRRLAERLGGPESADPDILHELLRTYLMFGQPERLDRNIATAWIRGDWEREFGAEPEVLARLSRHLDRLLTLRLDPVPLDDNLIALSRERLSQVPEAIQVYGRFRSEALLDSSHDFRLGEVLGPAAGRVLVAADGRDIGRLTVPGLYTAWGYSELFLKKSLDFVRDALAGHWVSGRPSAADPMEIERLHARFRDLYLADYQKAWSDLVGALRLRRARDLNQTIEWLDLLSRPDTPLRPLLQAIEANTSLSRISPLAGLAPDASAPQPDERTRRLLETARQASGIGPSGQDAVRGVEAAFEPLNALVRGGEGRPLPLDGVLNALAALHGHFLQQGDVAARGETALKSAAEGAAGGGGAGLSQAKSVLGRLPEPLRGGLLALAETGAGQTLAGTMAGARGELNAMLKAGVGTPCKAALAGRYPFTKGSPREATLVDFARFLAPNGVLDQFFQTHLRTFVDMNRPVWAEVSLNQRTLGLSAAALRQFQNAARIRAAFFPGGGPAPAVTFELKPLALDDDVAAFRLAVEGQDIVYRHGPAQVSRLQWPGPGAGSGVRLVFETLDGQQVSRALEGAWAWFRLVDESGLETAGTPERFTITFRAGGFSARYELKAGSVDNPFHLPELRAFACPDSL